jgi:hypothetical protein
MIIRTLGAAATVLLVVAACGGDRKDGAGSGTTSTTMGAPSDPRAEIFVAKGCPQCHSISALGIKSLAEVGPDLTIAYSDVQSRFAVTLEKFLHSPTGTMQVVLSSSIQLSPAERDSIIAILKGLHDEREARARQSITP